MEVDSAFRIGDDHTVCQDYALSGIINEKLAFALVCDGCSGSSDHYVDFGARLLAHAAMRSIRAYYKDRSFVHTEDYGIIVDRSTIQRLILQLAHENSISLQVNRRCLNATLIYSVSDKDSTFTQFFGDGHMHVKFRNGDQLFRTIEYGNAPFYLSLMLGGKKDIDAYYRERGPESEKNVQVKIVTWTDVDGSDGITEEIISWDEYPNFHRETYFVDYDVETVTVFSDGIGTFYDSNAPGARQFEDVVDSFTPFISFKAHIGEFVTRRLDRALSTLKSAGMKHFDDISQASIHVGPKTGEKVDVPTED